MIEDVVLENRYAKLVMLGRVSRAGQTPKRNEIRFDHQALVRCNLLRTSNGGGG